MIHITQEIPLYSCPSSSSHPSSQVHHRLSSNNDSHTEKSTSSIETQTPRVQSTATYSDAGSQTPIMDTSLIPSGMNTPLSPSGMSRVSGISQLSSFSINSCDIHDPGDSAENTSEKSANLMEEPADIVILRPKSQRVELCKYQQAWCVKVHANHSKVFIFIHYRISQTNI